MKKRIIKNKLYFIGASTGVLARFFYWKYVGCSTGKCSITSSPVNSSIYFAVFGAVFFGIFKKNTKETKSKTQ